MTKRIILFSLIGALLGSSAAAETNAPLKDSTQLAIVTTKNWDVLSGVMHRFARTNETSPWQEVGAAIPIVVGGKGLGWGRGVNPPVNLPGPVKHEGDGKSPAGIFRLNSAFGLAAPDKMKMVKLPYRQLTGGIECVDDVKSLHYNSIVDREKTLSADWNSSEHMRAVGEAYRLGVVVEHNTNPRETGGGSCIFIHLWDNDHTGTTGCTAMSSANMETLISWLDPKARPLLVQLTESDYQNLKTTWQLP